jgi:putative Mn2+ efflux pump MntP
MKAKLWAILLMSILFPLSEAMSCPFCYGAKDGKSAQNMAVAIWFLFGAIMTVLGGIGAFTFHLWKMSRTPLGPEEQLKEEDLDKYV